MRDGRIAREQVFEIWRALEEPHHSAEPVSMQGETA
jgi:hypothetical protein